MAKAIKHIKAGLLHIEVIGQVPDRSGRKPRAARSRPTSAAKAFYNLKTAWRELISIHAPRVGCDSVQNVNCFRTTLISIHAPRVGCDVERRSNRVST